MCAYISFDLSDREFEYSHSLIYFTLLTKIQA